MESIGEITPRARSRRSRRIITLYAVIVAAVVLVGGLAITGNLLGEDGSTTISIGEFAKMESIQAVLEDIYQPDRDSYGMGKFFDRETGRMMQFNIAGIFENLPPIPEDFWRVKYLMVTGQSDVGVLATLDEKYYKQPEFIRDTFVESGLNFWKAPDIYHWYPEGYGTYPHVEYVDTYPGAEFDAYTFTHTSWGVETYQGLMLVPVFLESVNLEDGPLVVKDHDRQKEYFEIYMDPNTVLLEPTYPVFTENWISRIRIHVKVSPDTPPGAYGIGYDVAPVPSELQSEWKSEYRELYQEKSGFGVTESQFQMLIRVY